MPDLTVGEFFNAVTKGFAVKMFFNDRENRVRFTLMRTVLNAPCEIDLGGRTGRAYSTEETDPLDLQLVYALDSTDETMKEPTGIFAPYGTGKDKLEFPGASLENSTLAGRVMPHTRTPGISPLFGMGENTSALRLLFWKGMQADANGVLYPAASHTLNGKSLQWNGEGGLYETYWKEFYRFKVNATPLEKDVAYTPEQLANLDFEQKNYFSGLNWLPVKVQVNLPVKNRAKVTFLRC
jgi:hypothetical protein